MDAGTTVLIVGGSLNGLTAAVLLAHRGVPCLVVERHPGTSVQYKFRGISPRSMEIYRSLGLEAEIRARDLIDDRSAYVARTKNLAHGEISWHGIPWSDTSDISPTTAATCDQDQLEPILRSHAEMLGADVQFNTELIDFTQDGDGVRARVRDRATGVARTVRARYLIGADGTRSQVREALGIGRHGPGVLQHWMNVIFEADLPTTLEGRSLRSIFITEINGTFVPRGDGRWLMAVQYVPERGERAEDFTPDYCRDLVRRGAGRPDLAVAVVDARPWEAAAAVADRYSDGRVFLVGDSAHVMPPTGGFGGNTGIQDAYNLAWKIAAVARGTAGRGLLETYDAERRPVADRTVAQALARLQAWFQDPSRNLPPPEPIVDDNAVIFGYRYPTGAFVAERDEAPDDFFEDPRVPSGRPGSRAPHLIVNRSGKEVSTVDLFGGEWILCGGPNGHIWPDLLERSPAVAALGVASHGIEPAGDLQDANHRWSAAYGLDPDGAVLIRPDGFVAWRRRNADGDAQAALDTALDRVLSRHGESRVKVHTGTRSGDVRYAKDHPASTR
jgi:2-polyprenyl-6-methoxyphenol hydroxylase-like FAD-dependent oxidoreductase